MVLVKFGFVFVVLVLVQSASAQKAAAARDGACKKPNGLFPHEKYCDYFYDCQEGEALLQACPNGLAFAGKQKGMVGNCDYPHKVDCPDDEGRVLGQTPISSDNCHYQYGIYAHQTSCTRYWQCWNGTATAQQCPFSLLYNDAMHACDWPDNVPDCQKHPICKDSPNGLIPIEKSCARYWLCVGGYPRLQRCPAGLAFNPETAKCELADSVPGCEPPPTTESPDDLPPPKQRAQAPPRQAVQARPIPVQTIQAPPQRPRFQPQPVAPAPTAPPSNEEFEEYDDVVTQPPVTQRPAQAFRRPIQFRQQG